jgi:hypothetical protein
MKERTRQLMLKFKVKKEDIFDTFELALVEALSRYKDVTDENYSVVRKVWDKFVVVRKKDLGHGQG